MAYTATDKPNAHNSSVLYTGNGGTQSITGVGFQPDIVWIKTRSTATYHSLSDAVNGTDLQLGTNDSNAGDNFTTAITAFDSDGFSLGSNGNTNTGSRTFVGWNWKAGTTSGIATNGSTTITPSAYSFNQTTGISIIKYTGNSTSGAKIAHGLGVKPDVMIVKATNAAYEWPVYHSSLGATKLIELQSTAAASTSSVSWNDTEPDSVNFTVQANNRTNTGSVYVGYMFAQKQGFSKFGTYQSNDNVDGPFIYTGFKPSWLMIKQYDASGNNWHMYDNKREGYNGANDYLEANTTAAEQDSVDLDILSNGFKIRTTGNDLNEGSYSYIYMAFAENPFVTSSGVPACAR